MFRLLSGILLCGLFQGIYSDCDKVYKSSISCFKDGAREQTIHLECPQDHHIVIKDAGYYIANTSLCPATLQFSSCKAESLTEKIKQKCPGTSCDYVVVEKSKDEARNIYRRCGGGHYVHLEYKCQPDQLKDSITKSISICEQKVWEGRMVRITSRDDPSSGNLIYKSSCACRVYVESDVQVEFRRLYFSSNSPSASSCDQKVALWNHNGNRVTICPPQAGTLRKDHLLGCYRQFDQVNLVFENSDVQYGAAFIIEASVSEIHTLTVECGMNATDMNWKTTSTTPRYRTTPPSPGTAQASNSGPSAGAMAGIAVGASIAIIVIIIVIVFVYRKKKAKAVEESQKHELPPNSFYATISKGKSGSTFTVGDKLTWPRIHTMPDAPEDDLKNY